jgi:hypothetical protein
MSEPPRRFRIIDGGTITTKPKAVIIKSGSRRSSIEKFECPYCSEEAKHPYGTLIEARIGAHVIDGELVGGALFWCCRRCERPYFHIRDLPVTK